MVSPRIIATLCVVLCFVTRNDSAPQDISGKLVTEDKAKAYLRRFGYIGEVSLPKNSFGPVMDPSAMENIRNAQLAQALRKFQRFAGIRETGALDADTRRAMSYRRCGVADLNKGMAEMIHEPKWKKTQLTWTIESYTWDLPKGDIRRAMHAALSAWSSVTPLQFTEVQSQHADLRIRFGSRSHGDDYPFDGKNGVLAHAMFPSDGRVHFDDDENWVYNDPNKASQYNFADLLTVAIHELGHALGLPHSRNNDAIMAAFYQTPTKGQASGAKLHNDDIRSIQRLYGSSRTGQRRRPSRPERRIPVTHAPRPRRPTRHRPTPRYPTSGRASSQCPAGIDAATKAINGRSYAFYRNQVWEFQGRNQLTNRRRLDQLFPNGPSSVTAAYTNRRQQLTVLFQARRLWAYVWDRRTATFKLHRDFPKDLPPSIRLSPRAAFSWHDGNTVIVDGRNFATYDEQWNAPTLIGSLQNYFRGFPSNANAVVELYQRTLLIISGSQYYLYDMEAQNVLNGRSKPINGFLQC